MSKLGFDAPTLAALAPDAIADWLREHGFQRSGAYGDYGALFSRLREGEETELLLPTTNRVRDFERRMAEFLNDLAEAEKRAPRDLLADLSLAPFDVVKVRAFDADKLGSVRLARGINLHSEAEKIMVAAASSAASAAPRKVWRGKRSRAVDAYLGNVRLGQTQKSSFVLTLLSPWNFHLDEQPSFEFHDAAFGRRVTRTLGTALVAAQDAVRKAGASGVAPIVEAYQQGVSANLCSALGALARDAGGIDLSVAWCPTRPEPDRVSVRFDKDDSPILLEAAKVLESQEPEPGTRLAGLISGITEDIERFDGRAILQTLYEGKSRRIPVEFGESDRETIFDAMKNKKFVRLVGDLVSKGPRLLLRNPRDIQTLSNDLY